MKIDTVTYTGLQIDDSTQNITSSTAGSRTYDWDSGTGFISTVDVAALEDDPATLSTFDTGYLTVAPADNFTIGTSDFTIEAWVYLEEALFGAGTIASQRYNATTELSFQLQYNNSGMELQFNNGSTVLTFDGTTIVADRWYHVAAVRYNGIVKMYIDGQPSSTEHDMTTLDVQYSDELIYIGAANDGGITNPVVDPWIGYMQDIRIMKSAGYDDPFTPDDLSTPGGGQVYGDPHIITLGGKKYTL